VKDGMMIVQLSGQVQKQLGQTKLVVITEWVNDVVLLLGHIMQMSWPEVLDDGLMQFRQSKDDPNRLQFKVNDYRFQFNYMPSFSKKAYGEE
jgi:hypothetical protein